MNPIQSQTKCQNYAIIIFFELNFSSCTSNALKSKGTGKILNIYMPIGQLMEISKIQSMSLTNLISSISLSPIPGLHCKMCFVVVQVTRFPWSIHLCPLQQSPMLSASPSKAYLHGVTILTHICEVISDSCDKQMTVCVVGGSELMTNEVIRIVMDVQYICYYFLF